LPGRKSTTTVGECAVPVWPAGKTHPILEHKRH
jgi:hypothetical protein